MSKPPRLGPLSLVGPLGFTLGPLRVNLRPGSGATPHAVVIAVPGLPALSIDVPARKPKTK